MPRLQRGPVSKELHDDLIATGLTYYGDQTKIRALTNPRQPGPWFVPHSKTKHPACHRMKTFPRKLWLQYTTV